MTGMALEIRGNALSAWDNRNGPRRCANTAEGLTRSSGTSREGLGMKPTQVTPRAKRPPSIPLSADDIDLIHRSRFFAKIQRAPGGCHIWIAATNSSGYGVFVVNGRQVYAHRVAWALGNDATLSTALSIDHLCRNRRCVNPLHLDAVTMRVNTERQPARTRTRTLCPQGHPYSGENLYVFPDGRRACRICTREAQVRHQAKKKALA